MSGVLLERRRRRKLAEIAQQIGLSFEPSAGGPEALGVSGCPLFNRGHARRVRNLMRGEVADVNMMLFDYGYRTGHGKNSSTHRQTVAAFRVPAGGLPTFQLSPEGFFQRIAAALGFDDIDFDSHPEFSKRYQLKGNDPDAVRRLFAPTVLEFFEQHAAERWSIEGAGQWLIVYKPHGRQKPQRWPGYMEQAFEVMNNVTVHAG